MTTGIKFKLGMLAALGSAIIVFGGLPEHTRVASAAAATVANSAAGTTSCTTSTQGYCIVNHGLGVVPSAVLVTMQAPNQGSVIISQADADQFTVTTFRVRAYRNSGTIATSTAVTFSWAAFAGDTPATTPPTTPPTTAPTTPPTTAPTSPTATTPPTSMPPAAWPDATNTGVPTGTVLTAYTGATSVPGGTVIDGKTVHACLNITGPGVIIKNSKVFGDCFYVIDAYGITGTPLTIQDSEVYCDRNGTAMNGTAIGEENVTTLRTNVHSCENGFDINGDMVIQDSYVHDLYQSGAAHSDGAQLVAGSHDVRFTHNTIWAGTLVGGTVVNGTSSIMTRELQYGQVRNITIDGNLLSGGAYSLYCQQQGKADNQVVTNNRFSTKWASNGGVYGPWTDCEDETHSGNQWYESGVHLD